MTTAALFNPFQTVDVISYLLIYVTHCNTANFILELCANQSVDQLEKKLTLNLNYINLVDNWVDWILHFDIKSSCDTTPQKWPR